MNVPLGVQVGVSLAWLLAYLVLSIRYDRVWDARMRAALSRRLGVDVQWGSIDGGGDPFSDSGGPPTPAWVADGRGTLVQQLKQTVALRSAQVAVMVLLGCVPPVGLLGLQILLTFHGLVVGATAFAVIAIFSLYWVGTYRRR
ncbi:hypothetical protein GCM10010193_16340 [Kitasatospora atroaurantiaca]|uniref:Uncharacterized protein n=1 Tax=Kitasatospora atroaurantiaca TaxID=285545 RepID=A0A561EXG4_9ACTN|nr:hypothetical protein [Kitasatospora atroaurantiaca]TWE20305.1 hypothetical protein FB465_5454 [Kitasatospora atroaurantiaca]